MATRDDILVRRALDGDKSAFCALVGRHQGPALASALHLVGDREAAQDPAQEAFVQAYRSLDNLHDGSKFGAWLYGILRNKARKYLARKDPGTLSLQSDIIIEPAAEASPSAEEDCDLLQRLQALPDESREILAAKYLHDMS